MGILLQKRDHPEVVYYWRVVFSRHTPRMFDSSPLKKDAWKMYVLLLNSPLFRGDVNVRCDIYIKIYIYIP